jgi:hypothetical protein
VNDPEDRMDQEDDKGATNPGELLQQVHEEDPDIGVPAGVHNPQFVPMPGEDTPTAAPDPEAEDDGPRVEHRDDETGDEGSTGDEGAARPLTEASPGVSGPSGPSAPSAPSGPSSAPSGPGGAGTKSSE